MRLIDLDPEWWTVVEPGKRYGEASSLTDAQGVLFECPKCRGHSVLVWFRGRGVPDAEQPGPARWSVSGTSFDDLTLSPSVHLTGPGCGWHGFVTAGEVTTC